MAAKHKPARNKRKREKFVANYGMTRGEWAKYKRENPEAAYTLRTKVAQRLHERIRLIKQ